MSSLNLVTGDKLYVTTGSTCTVDVVIMSDGGRIVKKIIAAETAEVLNASGDVTVDAILITNTSTSESVTVTPSISISGSSYVLKGPTILAPGKTLTYAEGVGFNEPATTLLNLTKYVTVDSVHPTAATFAVITGLTFPVLSGHVYTFEAALFHISNATTTGAQFGVGGVTATFVVLGSISTVLNSATSATLSTGVATAVDTAAIVQTTGAAANGPTWLAGSIQPSASGNLEIRATSEVTVAAGLTVLKGSWASVVEANN